MNNKDIKNYLKSLLPRIKIAKYTEVVDAEIVQKHRAFIDTVLYAEGNNLADCRKKCLTKCFVGKIREIFPDFYVETITQYVSPIYRPVNTGITTFNCKRDKLNLLFEIYLHIQEHKLDSAQY